LGGLQTGIGVRATAAIGIVLTPLTYVGQSQMNGDIKVFFALTIVQILVGCFTTSTVYNRLVAERFVSAKGIAFSLVMTGPPLSGAIASPILGEFIGTHGWRAGYLLLAGISLCFGLIALFLMPGKDDVVVKARAKRPAPPLKDAIGPLMRSPALWIIAVGMFLVNLPQALASSQLMVMLAENGVPTGAAWLLSVYAVGVIIGRFLCGLALDRFPPHFVAAIGLGLPGFGFLLLGSPYDAPLVLALSICLMGLAQGAEGDVAAYLVSRQFALPVFGLVVGIVGGATALGASVGAILLSGAIRQWDSFTPFIFFSATVTLFGALAFLFLRPTPLDGAQAQPDMEGVFTA
jgi:predicted MFS family arabinose efflux permease